MTAIRGPVITCVGPEIEEIAPTDRISFRVITQYDIATDGWWTRLDVKRNGEQFNVSMRISLVQPTAGTKLLDSTQPLMLPSKGVEQCAGGLVDRATLKQALLDLAEVL